MVASSASGAPYPGGAQPDGLESLVKEGKERRSFIHKLDKYGLSTYYGQLTMPVPNRHYFIHLTVAEVLS